MVYWLWESSLWLVVSNWPVKYSVNSCSSLTALSKVFLACSSVERLFISLQRQTVFQLVQSWRGMMITHTQSCDCRCDILTGKAHLPCLVTHRMLSTLRGLMKIAMGWRPASWRRFMAFPDTSSIQCLPWDTQTTWLDLFSLSSQHASSLNSPCQRLLSPTVCWFHTGGCYTVQPLWTCAPGSLAPWALWRKWSGNLCHPPHSLALVALCLRTAEQKRHIQYLFFTGTSLLCWYLCQQV